MGGGGVACDHVHVRHRVVQVYGKAAIGAPPMSVPHLDKRNIGGKVGCVCVRLICGSVVLRFMQQEMVLFGPFAGFSPRWSAVALWTCEKTLVGTLESHFF
eukprot:145985-Amphidinium_carterae.1